MTKNGRCSARTAEANRFSSPSRPTKRAWRACFKCSARLGDMHPPYYVEHHFEWFVGSPDDLKSTTLKNTEQFPLRRNPIDLTVRKYCNTSSQEVEWNLLAICDLTDVMELARLD